MSAKAEAAPGADLEQARERAEEAYSQHRLMCMRSPSYCWRCRELRAARGATVEQEVAR